MCEPDGFRDFSAKQSLGKSLPHSPRHMLMPSDLGAQHSRQTWEPPALRACSLKLCLGRSRPHLPTQVREALGPCYFDSDEKLLRCAPRRIQANVVGAGSVRLILGRRSGA
eukprot:gene10865-biopygen3242